MTAPRICAAAALAAATVFASGLQPEPGEATSRVLHLEGTVEPLARNTIFERPFTVPPGINQIEFALEHDGAPNRTVLDFGVRDPSGLRGWSGGRLDPIRLDALSATAGYLPGRVTAGAWALLIGVPNIRDGISTRYKIP